MLGVIASCIGAAAAALAAFEAVAARRDRRRYAPPGELVDVGTHRLHARSEGTGAPAVVFISGAGSTSAAWRLVQPEIAGLTSTCAYDRAGFTWSEPAREQQTMAAAARDLRRLLDGIGAQPPFILVPHSLGGAIAMQFAADTPDDVAGFVFIDAAYAELYETFLERFPQWRKRLRVGKFVIGAGRVAAFLGLFRIARTKFADRKLSKQDADPVNAFGRTPRYFTAMRAEMNGLLASREMPQPSPPTDRPAIVLTHGKPHALFKEDDGEALWSEMQRRLAARFDSGELCVVDAAAHFIQIDRPDAVVEAIRSVVARVQEATA